LRLQLQGFQFAYAPDAVVAKAGAHRVRQRLQAVVLIRSLGARALPSLPVVGARRNLVGAAKSWAWLVISLPLLFERRRRTQWARAAGMRSGRLVGSVTQAVFFP